MRWMIAICMVSVVSISVGCGGSSVPESTKQEQAPTSPEAATPEVATVTPEKESGFVAQRPSKQYSDPRLAVNDFLIAVKGGKDQLATELLTTAAQQEAWENGLAISGEGFPDAKFQITELEYRNENTEAHVMSTWEDVTTTGEAKAFKCLWMLRSEPHGWCIYGMATKYLDHLDPIILNFENQAEMQERQAYAQKQIQLYAQQQQTQRQGPEYQTANQPQDGQLR